MTLQELYQICPLENVVNASTSTDPWKNLANAIVEKAVDDYCMALAGKGRNQKPAAQIKAECEEFFRSEWFNTLYDLDGETVIHRLSTYCENKRKGK